MLAGVVVQHPGTAVEPKQTVVLVDPMMPERESHCRQQQDNDYQDDVFLLFHAVNIAAFSEKIK